uniref:Uncharacterized protein n=1 Tax=Anguilla anguilla TaxID=7936 RepID=A0A0E9XH83_ANGAN
MVRCCFKVTPPKVYPKKIIS